MPPRRRYTDEDTTDAFLDKPDLLYESGSREDALRAQGVEPGDKAALKRHLRQQGIKIPPLPAPVPK